MKIAVLTSGGVDSSVALRLLHARGDDVTAFYLKIWLEDELETLGDCPWEEDLEYVRKICDDIDVPLRVVALQQEYRERIIAYTLAEVRRGRTPNPDIFCNNRIKFGVFTERIEADFSHIATGHYARVDYDSGRYHLKTAPDPVKDQTYFLSHLEQSHLARALFPIGEYPKSEVRKLARDYNLPNQDRPDSQGLCFLGKIRFRDFIEHHLGRSIGPLIEEESGTQMGEHNGFWFYTIGQRSGLGLSGGPWYVTGKDVEKNIVYISRDYFAIDRQRNEFTVAPIHWIGEPPPEQAELEVKLRHGPERVRCRIGPGAGERRVTIDERDQGIAPGQFAVFYHEDECLGCAMIAENQRS